MSTVREASQNGRVRAWRNPAMPGSAMCSWHGARFLRFARLGGHGQPTAHKVAESAPGSNVRWIALLALGAGLLLQAGCSSSGFVREVERDTRLAEERGGEEAIYRDLIAGLLQQDKHYAALAHIEEYKRQDGATPELQLYEARALYGLELDGQAKAVFLDLRDTALDGEAQHGLGLIAARDGDLAQATEYFIRAVRQRPTDIAMRNDLGFALLRAGRFRDARLQLSTALELSPDNTRAQNTLIMMLMIQGDRQGVQSLAANVGIDEPALARLRAQSERLRALIAPTSSGG